MRYSEELTFAHDFFNPVGPHNQYYDIFLVLSSSAPADSCLGPSLPVGQKKANCGRLWFMTQLCNRLLTKMFFRKLYLDGIRHWHRHALWTWTSSNETLAAAQVTGLVIHLPIHLPKDAHPPIKMQSESDIGGVQLSPFVLMSGNRWHLVDIFPGSRQSHIFSKNT